MVGALDRGRGFGDELTSLVRVWSELFGGPGARLLKLEDLQNFAEVSFGWRRILRSQPGDDRELQPQQAIERRDEMVIQQQGRERGEEGRV